MSILSLPFCVVAIVLLSAAVNFDVELTALPAAAMAVLQKEYFIAFGIADMLGYYLLRVPLIVLLWQWLRPGSPLLVDIATICGLLFVFIAVLATSSLVGGAAAMAGEYAMATASQRLGLEWAWKALVLTIYQGPWHFMLLPWAVWCALMGRKLVAEMFWLGWMLQLLGLSALLSLMAPLMPALHVMDEVQTLLMPIWIFLMGAMLRTFPCKSHADDNRQLNRI